ncbi:hypothetical protein SRABI133_03656 [Peribacillus simplex]|uniref:Uncharacterized protein n=1 Tax=Peribacillus simplex TaxID=1478 RepID=A0A9W4KZG5_9BACI|nr:hypothetical protein SRABI133_03656 [Peribacillus simplex]
MMSMTSYDNGMPNGHVLFRNANGRKKEESEGATGFYKKGKHNID